MDVDMALDAYCMDWANTLIFMNAGVFASALTGQTIKVSSYSPGASHDLNVVGLLCLFAFCLGSFCFSWCGVWILCRTAEKFESFVAECF